MDREILFRGKSILTGIFIEGNLIIGRNCETSIVWFNTGQKECWTSVCPYSIGQYTGLNDCNGDKIFEGDIVLVGEKLKAKVVFYKGAFRMQDEFTHNPTVDTVDMGNIMRDYSVRVIGNVHDNPELLKQQQQ